MQKKLISLMVAVIMAISVMPLGVLAFNDSDRAYIYVATDGNDGASGTVDAPLATVNAARDKIREMKKNGSLPKNGAVVYLRGGDYSISEQIKLTKEDSGTETAPIVYRSYPGEKAVLVGGASINPKDLAKVTDRGVLDRVIDESARNQIVSVNLKAKGFFNIGEPYLEGAYSYSEHLQNKAPLRSPELFVDGKLMTVARYPNTGYITVDGVESVGFSRLGIPGAVGEGDPKTGFEIVVGDKRFEYWTKATPGSILLYGYWYYDWADSSVPVKSINTAKGTITSVSPSLYGVKPGQRFYAYNLLEEIDVPGEYFIDRTNGMLYLYPPVPIEEMKEIRLSILEDDLISVDGADYVEFKDMKMTSTRKSAVRINNSKYVRVVDCEMEYTADTAVIIWDGARNCGVVNSYVHDTNGGIMLRGGVYDTLEPGNNYAENNHIERFARLTKTYNGGVTLGLVGNIARHNEIHEGDHLAIFFYGQDNKIEYNNIYNVVKESDDAAAIYGGQSWVGRGLQIRYNYIHDIRSDSGQGVGRAAVYLDGGQCDVTMMGNVLDNIEGSGFWINGGQDNNVYNNIMLNIDDGAVYLTDIMATGIIPLEHMLSAPDRYPWNDPESEPWKNEIWRERYPEMIPQFESGTEALLPYNNMMHNNLIVNSKPTKFYGSAASFLDAENNWSTKKDPGFYDMEKKNYLLKEDSDVFEEIPGFKALPFTRMGRYDERALQRVDNAIALQVGSPFARANGKDLKIDESNLHVAPYIDGDKTMLPLRFIAEQLGLKVDFSEADGKISISGGTDSIEFYLNSTEAKKNGEMVAISKAPYIKEGRTLVPLRDISELFGKKVFWDDCGLIVISDREDLFSEKSDSDIISYLHEYLTIY